MRIISWTSPPFMASDGQRHPSTETMKEQNFMSQSHDGGSLVALVMTMALLTECLGVPVTVGVVPRWRCGASELPRGR